MCGDSLQRNWCRHGRTSHVLRSGVSRSTSSFPMYCIMAVVTPPLIFSSLLPSRKQSPAASAALSSPPLAVDGVNSSCTPAQSSALCNCSGLPYYAEVSLLGFLLLTAPVAFVQSALSRSTHHRLEEGESPPHKAKSLPAVHAPCTVLCVSSVGYSTASRLAKLQGRAPPT